MNINAQCLFDLLVLMAVTVVAYAFCATKKSVNRIEGIVLVLLYAIYLTYAIIR
ncbi:MAG: hypothetical protein K2K34_10130 [Oscillospiraceae bacterium]|nr:hypothetical protein [Oscillospiraceae bacterium]